MSRDTAMDSKMIQELVTAHYKSDVGKFNKLYALYCGEHDIAERVITDVNKPNNKLVNNYYGQIVDDVTGYFLGKPIVVNIDSERQQDQLDAIFSENEADDLFMEVGKEMSIKGKSAIMIYQDEEAMTQLIRLPAEQTIFIYDASKQNQVLYALRVYELNVATSSAVSSAQAKPEPVKYVEVYDAVEITYWKEVNGNYFLDDTREVNPEPHIFGDVPLVEFENNEEQMGDFEKVISLVNDYDKIISDQSNEHEAYRNAYLVLKNMVLSSDSLQKLKEQGVIEVMENGDAKFLTKDVQTDAVNAHLDRLEENIYKFTQIPNLSDEKFAGNLSGVAIKFKLFSMENKCIVKERKMTKAIRKLLKLISVPLGIKSAEKFDMTKVQVIFSRNVPDNLHEIAEVVGLLNGVVDKETLLSLLPFIDDPTYILEKLQAEQDIYAKDMAKFQQANMSNEDPNSPTQQPIPNGGGF
jgi:SPP1 family phage portal protein